MKENKKKPQYYMLDIQLSKEQRKYYESKGLFCYDMRGSCLYDDGGTVEKCVIANNCGSIITTVDLNLTNEKYYVDLDSIIDNFEEMSYEEYCKIKYKELDDELTY